MAAVDAPIFADEADGGHDLVAMEGDVFLSIETATENVLTTTLAVMSVVFLLSTNDIGDEHTWHRASSPKSDHTVHRRN